MTPPMRWLALLASGGAVAGGAAALGHASASATTATTSKPAASSVFPRDAAEVKLLIAETKSLQTALTGARGELLRVLSHPGGHTIVYKSSGASSISSLTGLQAQLSSEQTAITAERSQLQGEQGQLGGEAQALATRQAELVKEAAALAAEAKKLSQPSTHATTGASGGGNDD